MLLKYVMQKKLAGLVIVCCCTLAVTISSCSGSKPATKPVAAAPAPALVDANVAPAIETEILNLVNKYRKTKGLSPLQTNFVVESQARRHTLDMATRRVPFGHDGIAARSKLIRTKISGVNAVAENVAYGNQTAESVVDSWLNSPGHKKNIEGNYRLTGIGVARDIKSQLYFTQIFTD